MYPKLFRTVLMFGLVVIASSQLLSQESRAQPQALSGQISGQVRYAGIGGQPAFNVLVRCDSFNSGSCGQEMTESQWKVSFYRVGAIPIHHYRARTRFQ